MAPPTVPGDPGRSWEGDWLMAVEVTSPGQALALGCLVHSLPGTGLALGWSITCP